MDKALAFEGATTQVSWDNVTGKPDSYPPETHTHDMIQVTGLEDELSSMQSAIANKANSSHTHNISNITNLQSTLNGKANTSHTHAIADVTNLQTTLNGKAASSHNHSASNITSGTLPTSRGGTGITANPSMLVDLNRTTAASVFASAPRPGVTGTLPVARGGTGVTSLSALKTALNVPDMPLHSAYCAIFNCILGASSSSSDSQMVSTLSEFDGVIILSAIANSRYLGTDWAMCFCTNGGLLFPKVSGYTSCDFYTMILGESGRTYDSVGYVSDGSSTSYTCGSAEISGNCIKVTAYSGPGTSSSGRSSLELRVVGLAWKNA